MLAAAAPEKQRDERPTTAKSNAGAVSVEFPQPITA
jgi:hypothetical protein